MSVSFTGDFKKFAKLSRDIFKLSTPTARRYIADAMGQEALKLVRAGFNQETDPYGEAWTPLAPSTVKRKGSSRILRRTKALMNNWALTSSDWGFRVTSGQPYSLVHQHGADFMANGRSSFRTRKGQFKSIKQGSRQKRPLVSVHRNHHMVIPSRMMVPIDGRGLGRWGYALSRAARREIKALLKTW